MKFIPNSNIIHTFSKDHKIADTVNPGEKFQIETASPGIPDEIFEKDYSDGNYPKRVLSITGPVYINGAEPGDTLKIKVHSIELKEQGKMWMGQWMGILMDEVDHSYLKKVDVTQEKVFFTEDLHVDTTPMIGTIAVTPADKEVECLYPGDFGGNMDSKTIKPGSIVYLPVQIEGALLAVGDVHGAMGDGEVFGTGVEIGSIVTLEVELIKNQNAKYIIVDSDDIYSVIASDKDLLSACKMATKYAIDLISKKKGLSFDESYAFVSQFCDLRICQVVNRVMTVRFDINKKHIEGGL